MTTKQLSPIIPILLFLIPFLVLSGCTEQDVDNNDGENGLNFTFTTLSSEEKNLKDYYGKPIVLDLMGVNCQPCFYQMFVLYEISQNYSDTLTIISIDVWTKLGEDAALVEQYLSAFYRNYNLVLDWTFGLDDDVGTIGNQYASEGVPTIYILDEKGKIYYTKVGYEPYPTLAEKIDELIEKK